MDATDKALKPDDVAQLLSLERQLIDPAVRTDVAQLRTLLAPTFVEIGQSGRRYDRDAIIDALQHETPAESATVEQFEARPLSDNLALVIYRTTVVRDGQTTHAQRSSIWYRTDGSWAMLYHQGTPLPTPAYS